MALIATQLTGCAQTLGDIAETQDTGLLNAGHPAGNRQPPDWSTLFFGGVFDHGRAYQPEQAEQAYLRCSSMDGRTGAKGSGVKLDADGKCAPPAETAKLAPAKAPAPASNTPRCDLQSKSREAILACVNDFGMARTASHDHPLDSARSRGYLSLGMTLSDNLCLSWFDRLDVANTTINEFGDTVSQTGSVTTTLMGAFRSSSQWIGAISAAFGFVKASADNAQRNYIVAADLGAVKYAVQGYRSGYRKEIEAAQGEWSYSNASDVLNAYVDTCSALSVRRFIARKLDPSPAIDNRIYQVALEQFITDFKKSAGTKLASPEALTVGTLPLFYAANFLASGLPADAAKALAGQANDAGLPTMDAATKSTFQNIAVKDAVLERIVQLASGEINAIGQSLNKTKASSQKALDDAKAKAEPTADEANLQAGLDALSPQLGDLIEGKPKLDPQSVIAVVASKSAKLTPGGRSQLSDETQFPGVFGSKGEVRWAPDPAKPADRWAEFSAAVATLKDPWPQTLKTGDDGYVAKYVGYLNALYASKTLAAPALGKAKPAPAPDKPSKPADDAWSIWPMPQAPDGRPLNRPPPVTSN